MLHQICITIKHCIWYTLETYTLHRFIIILSNDRSAVLPKGELSASAAIALGVYWENPALRNIWSEPERAPHECCIRSKCLLQLDYRKIDICVTHADSHDWLQELITRDYSLALSSHLITLGLRLNWATVAICIYICQADF